jgi:hypothetical protein
VAEAGNMLGKTLDNLRMFIGHIVPLADSGPSCRKGER